MSVRVLVIPEDPTHNGYILKPLVEMVLDEVGKPNAKVTLLTNPRLRGYDHAVDAIRNELARQYAFFNLWLFFPDADRANNASIHALETELSSKGVSLLRCAATPGSGDLRKRRVSQGNRIAVGRRAQPPTNERGGLPPLAG